MRDHLLGYPPVLSALFPAEPSKVQYTPKRERLTSTEEMLRGCRDRQEQEAMPAPAVVAPFREPAYSTEHYAATYVPDGPAITLDGGKTWQPASESAFKVSVVTDEQWHEGAPPSIGWWLVKYCFDTTGYGTAAFWDGNRYTIFRLINGSNIDLVAMHPDERGTWLRIKRTDGNEFAHWRGPRLVGDDWPEPEAPTPFISDQEISAIYVSSPISPERGSALKAEFGVRYTKEIPQHRRAEFIARCNANGDSK